VLGCFRFSEIIVKKGGKMLLVHRYFEKIDLKISGSVVASLAMVAMMAMAIQLGISPASAANNKEMNLSIAAVPNKLRYEAHVPREQRKSLDESVSVLYAVPANPQKPSVQALQKLMRLPDMAPTRLQQWLEARVHYVVNGDFNLDRHVFPLQNDYVYPNADQLPDVIREQDGQDGGAGEENDDGVMMANLSAAVYIFGKTNKALVGVDLGRLGKIAVSTARVGLLQIGPALFQDFAGDGQRSQNVLNDIVHTATLFHEARHSDGHGVSLGFFHVRCPKGSDYAGLPACDLASNGPYQIGANMVKALADSCEKCSARTKRVLNVVYLDFSERMLGAEQAPKRLSKGGEAGVDWDDAPEGK
jgi:hypothetical protein